ncbi:DUF4197 domain-containing protein [Thiomicrolovo sp. ZZH C-3]
MTSSLAVVLTTQTLNAGLFDSIMETVTKTTSGETQTKDVSGLSITDIDGGLREALNKGVKQAIEQLGQENGFLGNSLVKIPVPEKLMMVEKGLRKAGMGKYADDFVTAMNRAAEKAVPETAKIFADTISAMSIEDAKKILTGPDNAATEYFREHSGPALQAAILPIVQQYTQETEVTQYYKTMVDTYDSYGAPVLEQTGVTALLGSLSGESNATQYDPRDLDGYITAKGVDGLFTVIADEEKAIRNDPAARTTELLQKVFGN